MLGNYSLGKHYGSGLRRPKAASRQSPRQDSGPCCSAAQLRPGVLRVRLLLRVRDLTHDAVVLGLGPVNGILGQRLLGVDNTVEALAFVLMNVVVVLV